MEKRDYPKAVVKKALETKGSKFSYKIDHKLDRHYHVNLLGFFEINLLEAPFDAHHERQIYKTIDTLKDSLPQGAVVEIEHIKPKKHKDACKYQAGYPYVTVEEHIIATITVPESVSKEIYKEFYADEAFAFRDYLLKNRRDKLLAICNDFPDSCKGHFYVFKNRIQDDNTSECCNWATFYYQYGLGDLKNPAQYYGLSLALLVIMGRNPDNYLVEELASGDICIRIAQKAFLSKPKIEQW